MTTVMASVAVRTNERGVPEGLIWEQARFGSTDTPTLLESDYEFVAMHPPAVHFKAQTIKAKAGSSMCATSPADANGSSFACTTEGARWLSCA